MFSGAVAKGARVRQGRCSGDITWGLVSFGRFLDCILFIKINEGFKVKEAI